MKKFLIALAAVSTLATAPAAFAQAEDYNRFSAEAKRLIERGRASGALTPEEVQGLYVHLEDLENRIARYGADDQFDDDERRDIDARYLRLIQLIEQAEKEGAAAGG